MICHEAQTLIDLAPLEALEELEKTALDEHLASCPSCTSQLQQLTTAYEAVERSTRQQRATLDPKGAHRIALKLGLLEHTDKTASAKDLSMIKTEKKTYRVSLSCLYCHDDLPREQAVYCATCLASHHSACFIDHGRCSAPGCSTKRVVRPQQIIPPINRTKNWLWAPLKVAAALLIAAVVFPMFLPARVDPRLSMNLVSPAPEAFILFKARIDGSDSFHIDPNSARWSHHHWGSPSAISLNGKAWKLEERSMLVNSGENRFLPHNVDFSTARIVWSKGRDLVSLDAYQHKLSLHISDSPNGAADYQVMIALNTDPLSGVWDGGPWGELRLNRQGGTYSENRGSGQGRLELKRISTNHWQGFWGESKKRHGTLDIMLSADKNELIGSYQADPRVTLGRDEMTGEIAWTRSIGLDSTPWGQ